MREPLITARGIVFSIILMAQAAGGAIPARAATPVAWKPRPWSPARVATRLALHDRMIGTLASPRAIGSSSRAGDARALPEDSTEGASLARPLTPAADTISACGSWSALWPDGAPFLRYEHAMIYDSSRDRLVVFGGISGTTAVINSDVWYYDLAGVPQWTRVAITGFAPEAREGATAIYDAPRDRMIVYGGEGYGGDLGDVWALSLSTWTWTQLSPSGPQPPARALHTAIYDAARERMVVFGGIQSPWSMLGDVWTLSLSGTPAWSPIVPSGSAPSARAAHAAIYDAPRDRMLVFGGNDSPASGDRLQADLWSLSFAGTPAWTSLATTGTPPSSREFHRALYDVTRNRMIVSGGYTGGTPVANEQWGLSLTNSLKWTKLAPAGTPPPPLLEHAMVHDTVRDRLLSFGGFGAAQDQIWAMTFSGSSTWSQIIPLGQPPRQRTGHTAVLDRPRRRMILYGGESEDGSALSDVWSFTLSGAASWTHLLPNGVAPIRRYQAAAVDTARDRLVIFGGTDGTNPQNDAWTLSLSGTMAWNQLHPSGTPPPARIAASAIYDPDRDRIVVYGGFNDLTGIAYNDAWALSLSGTGTWTQLVPAGVAAPFMHDHAAIYDRPRNRMVVVGPDGGESSVWQLSFAGAGTWSPIAGVEVGGIARPSAVFDAPRNRMLLFSELNPLYALPLAGTAGWKIVGEVPAIDLRDNARAFFDPDSDRVVFSSGAQPYTGNATNGVQALAFPSNLFAVNLDAGIGGQATIDPQQSCYGAGTSVTLTAIPDQGFVFTGWSGDASGNANPLVLPVNGHKNLVAQFAQPPPVCGEWRRLLLDSGTLPMSLASILYDPVRHRLLAFGAPDADSVAIVWQMRLDGGSADWQPLSTSGPSPYGRNGVQLAYDSLRDRMLLYGGYGAFIYDDVWALTLSGTPTWSQLVPANGPSGLRFMGSAIYDPVRDRLIVFGGRGYSTNLDKYRDDTWQLTLSDPPTWSELAAGSGPVARCGHTAIYDPVRDRMIVHGGFLGVSALADVWGLSLAEPPAWSPILPGAGSPPAARGGATAIYDPVRDRMIVYGGGPEDYTLGWPYGQQGFFDDAFALSLAQGPAWVQFSGSGTLPGSRFTPSAAYDAANDRMVIADGIGSIAGNWNMSFSYRRDTHALSLGGGYWLDLAIQGASRGSVERSPVADCYPPGTQVTLTAVPTEGNQLDRWQGDLSGSDNPLSVLMDRNRFGVAVFEATGSVAAPPPATPARLELERNSPNPFTVSTRIGFGLPAAARVELKVYDAAGRLVRTLTDSELPAGTHSVSWDGHDTSGHRARAGIYFYRLHAGTVESTRRMVLVE